MTVAIVVANPEVSADIFKLLRFCDLLYMLLLTGLISHGLGLYSLGGLTTRLALNSRRPRSQSIAWPRHGEQRVSQVGEKETRNEKNQVIRNEETGESLTMLASEHDSGEKRQIYRVELLANCPSPPLHYHVAFIERFSVVEGTLDVYLGKGREHRKLSKGESVTVEKLQLQTFANSSVTSCTIQVETVPAGGVVRAFQLAYGVANEGNAGEDGLPANPIVRLRFVQISQGFLPRIPMAVQRAVCGIAAVISKVTGLEAHIQKHLIEEE